MVAKGSFCGLEAYLEFLMQGSCSCNCLNVWGLFLVAKNGLRKEQGTKIERENKLTTCLENPGVHQDFVQMLLLHLYSWSQIKQRK